MLPEPAISSPSTFHTAASFSRYAIGDVLTPVPKQQCTELSPLQSSPCLYFSLSFCFPTIVSSTVAYCATIYDKTRLYMIHRRRSCRVGSARVGLVCGRLCETRHTELINQHGCRGISFAGKMLWERHTSRSMAHPTLTYFHSMRR